MVKMTDDLERVLVTEAEIAGKIKELAARISFDYADKNPLFVGILRGSVVFLSDLIRACQINCEIDFMSVSSYAGGSQSSGTVKIIKDLEHDIGNKHVIIVEDILDTGLTLSYIMDLLASRKPKSIRLCAFLDKPARREIPVRLDYGGFEVPDEFIVGYGLDYGERYRNLPYLAVLKRDIYYSGS